MGGSCPVVIKPRIPLKALVLHLIKGSDMSTKVADVSVQRLQRFDNHLDHLLLTDDLVDHGVKVIGTEAKGVDKILKEVKKSMRGAAMNNSPLW